MPGLVPGIHAFLDVAAKTWMAGTRLRQGFAGPQSHLAGEALAKTASPGMTRREAPTSCDHDNLS
jgi:hypothetical protein